MNGMERECGRIVGTKQMYGKNSGEEKRDEDKKLFL
jgi:hypothetical protein